jgi:hypothetical protein
LIEVSSIRIRAIKNGFGWLNKYITFLTFLLEIMTFAPSLASFLAMAKPIPSVDAVTMATEYIPQ